MKLEKIIQKYGIELLEKKIKENKNINSCSISIFGYSSGKTTRVLREFIEWNNCDTSHFDKQYKNRKHSVIERRCPNCGKTFKTNTKDDSKTCSWKCSNTFFSEKRKKSFVEKSKTIKCSVCGVEKEVDIRARKDFICNKCKVTYNPIKHKTKKCIECEKPIYNTNKSGYCKECLPKSTEYRKKLSRVQKKLIKEGKHKGWKSRKGLEPSYPEKYFIDLLNNESIKFQREVKIGKYFIDFLLPGNFVLEIDGKQHNYPERRKSDIDKDKFLLENGFDIFRIQWYNPSVNKDKLYPQILKFYNRFYSKFI